MPHTLLFRNRLPSKGQCRLWHCHPSAPELSHPVRQPEHRW